MSVDTHLPHSVTKGDLIAVPAALIGAAICSITPLFQILLWLSSMVLHECGHTIGSLLNSRLAVPTFGFTLSLQCTPSILTFGALSVFGWWWWRAAARARYRVLGAVPAVLAPCLLIGTVALPAKRAQEMALLAGQGGELVLGVLLIALFFEPMPRRFNWAINRYLFLTIGAFALFSCSRTWIRAGLDIRNMPMGAFIDIRKMFGESSESAGDMDRLIRDFGWTAEGLVFFYLALTLAALGGLVGVYLFNMRRYRHQGASAQWSTRIIPRSPRR